MPILLQDTNEVELMVNFKHDFFFFLLTSRFGRSELKKPQE